ncbi:MAG: rhomboid family intramembrane serine protease [Oleiphilaceae bacterium]|nr:rhomboid family intramembrane serine protease [Oleiphilaceae bacterium]
MYRVKQFDTDVDLADFSTWLKQQGVDHRISEESGQQVLWLDNPDQAEPVLAALDQYLHRPGVKEAVTAVNESPVFVGGRWQPSPKHAPFVLATIIICALVAWMTSFGQSPLTMLLMIVDPQQYTWTTFDQRLAALTQTLVAGELWRPLTPAFLHFSWSHLIFNSVMMWFLGSQIEWFDGRLRLVFLFLVTALISNGLQFAVSGPLFGGLSGVVYGVLGYCWLSQQRQTRFQFPPALMVFAVVWMLIGFTELPVWLGIGPMANEAHLGGLLAGLLMAVLLTPPKKSPT